MSKKIISSFLMVILSVVIVGCEVEEQIPEKVDQDTKVEEQEEIVGTEVFEVGDTIKMGNLEYTVHGVRSGKEGFTEPDEGNKYVYIDITVENAGNEEENISSLLQFSLLDLDGREHDLALSANAEGSVDGSIGSGRKKRGELAYEVPEELTEAELEIEGDLFASGIAVVAINIVD